MDKMLKKATVLLRQRDRINSQLRQKDEEIRKFCQAYAQQHGLRAINASSLITRIDYESKKAAQ